MIRDVVLLRLPEDADEAAWAALEGGLAGIAALDLPGQMGMCVGLDAGLREGGWSAAITSDWVDADAYRAYELDRDHHRHRARIVAVCAEVARVQLESDPPASP